ncbi:MAG: hypothetical protein RL115_981 [Bacteroidota bacterium]
MKKFTLFFIFAIMAIFFSSITTNAQINQISGSPQTATTASTTLTISKPTSLAVGDVMLANIVQSDNDGADGGDLSNATLAGWTLIAGNQTGVTGGGGGDEWWGTLLYKVATAADVAAADFSFNLSGSADDGSGAIMAFRNVDLTGGVTVSGAPGGPFNATPSALYQNVNSDQQFNANAITNANANAAIIMFGVLANDVNLSNWNTTTPGALTEIYDLAHNADLDMGSAAAWALKANTGSTGAGTASIAGGANVFNASLLIALKAAPTSVSITPATTQNIMPGESVSFTASAINYPAGGNYTYSWSVSPAATIPGTNPNVIAGATDTKAITFNTPGSYTVSVNITRASTSTNLTTATVTVNVLAPNLWSGSGTAPIRKYVVDPNAGAIIAGPSVVATPLTSTAAVAKNQPTSTDAEGCIYYLNRDENDLLNGVVTIYSMRPDGTNNGSRGTIDMNGPANDGDFSFVRFGFDAIGRGWILAGSDASNNIFIASFTGNGINPISGINTFGNTSLTVAAPGTATEFQNGDLAITANGTLYVLANVTDGATHIYTLNSLVTPTTLTRKWTVVPAPNTIFSGSVNGLAFTQAGSLYFSTSTAMYFIDQNTVNNAGAGTVQATLVPNTTGLALTDLASDKFPERTTLPITLLSFGGTYKNQQTVLNWTTENVKDFASFEIERSENGMNFNAIGTKEPINTLEKVTYQYTDNIASLIGGVFYYRLKMVDLNGAVKYSHAILVRRDGAIKDVTVSPNPIYTGAMATIRLEANRKGLASFKVVDLSGRTLLTQNSILAEGTNSISLSNINRLQTGMYILVVNDGVTMQTTKFQVVK